MIFSSVATAVILAVGCQALVIPRLQHLADFRLFSGRQCGPVNLGIWTVVEGDFKYGECQSLRDDTVESIRVQDVVSNCKLSFYADDKCQQYRHVITAHQCGTARPKFKAFTINCEPHAPA
ncbi:hypothetical protein L249_6567 [Ophiocordyceps polyrhachis-furcata BCC 54312]|uniref:Uncharacterized protein n=1 Tax=Ophiocordyceps polyrhachis-furcata BCC 54312 TaxID=1330021 RepID=A0A367LLW6_9HYPO|nr:hypothetical protein L249_6567 [Ophiocordyceps polyrhachis-furcata BCC 54312]